MELTSRRSVMILAGAVWPLLLVGLALLWPSQVVPAGLAGLDDSRGFQTGTPPLDSGSDLAVLNEGSTRIFWTIPEDGTVEFTIEIDPAGAPPEAGTPGVSAPAADPAIVE